MKYDLCPLCGEAVDVGSHWDCVFSMVADWVKHQERLEKESGPELDPEEKEKENG